MLNKEPDAIRICHRQAMTLEQFNQDPQASNRIWIAEQPLEEWLGASIGSSPCCSVCGDAACRTLECGNQSYDAIPPQLIIKANNNPDSFFMRLAPLR